jgi:hypothetical protein
MPSVSRCVTITCRIGAGTLFLFVLIFLGLDSAKSETSPRVTKNTICVLAGIFRWHCRVSYSEVHGG